MFSNNISIRAPLAGSDKEAVLPLSELWSFQSTLPSQGATQPDICRIDSFRISIHAPLVGSDICTSTLRANIIISIHAPLAGSDINL